MSEESKADDGAQRAADRIQARLAKLQAWGKRIAERVPRRARRNAQRVFSLLFFA